MPEFKRKNILTAILELPVGSDASLVEEHYCALPLPTYFFAELVLEITWQCLCLHDPGLVVWDRPSLESTPALLKDPLLATPGLYSSITPRRSRSLGGITSISHDRLVWVLWAEDSSLMLLNWLMIPITRLHSLGKLQPYGRKLAATGWLLPWE